MSDRFENSLPTGWPDWLNTTTHIGSHYPYYRNPNPNYVSLDIGDIIENIPKSERELDVSGVIEILFYRRLFADRTLVQGVRRSPWLAKPSESGWSFHDIPNHNTRIRPDNDIVDELKTKLYDEAKRYISNAKSVGILLSGGLDSRVVSGILRQLQIEGYIDSVSAYTWGINGCKDVEYAKRISVDFGWDFEHIELSPEQLWDNIILTGKLGAEFAPYHLHALPEIREKNNVDVIIAGSYGNSIGRGEYSGSKVTQLDPIIPKRLNKFGLLPQKVISKHSHTVYGDGYGYRSRTNRSELYQYQEIEQQLHYMRRGLQSCMTHVAERTPLHQLFTSPEVVELMWSLKPEIRGLSHYKKLLKQLPGSLHTIPDAKRGNLFKDNTATNDELYTHSHKYGVWLRNDLRTQLIDLINSGPVVDHLFNEQAIDRLFRIWTHGSTISMNKVDDIVAWLASLTIFLDTYSINVPNTDTSSLDRINGIIGPVHAATYQTARNIVRK
ncbi:asparagine synthase-related protein [Halostagnicola bangensis]